MTASHTFVTSKSPAVAAIPFPPLNFKLGWRAGVITFLGDCLKCVAAALVVHLIEVPLNPNASLILFSRYLVYEKCINSLSFTKITKVGGFTETCVNTHADLIALLSTYAGLGAVLGHNYPFYLKFKGGKIF